MFGTREVVLSYSRDGAEDDAKWIVEHVNGNVPQSLTNPVQVSY